MICTWAVGSQDSRWQVSLNREESEQWGGWGVFCRVITPLALGREMIQIPKSNLQVISPKSPVISHNGWILYTFHEGTWEFNHYLEHCF